MALSYVWGTCEKDLFVTSNFNDSSPNSDGSLSSAAYAALIQDSLSPVLEDAMSFTESIGERYLWLDHKGILQDNSEHLAYLSVCSSSYWRS